MMTRTPFVILGSPTMRWGMTIVGKNLLVGMTISVIGMLRIGRTIMKTRSKRTPGTLTIEKNVVHPLCILLALPNCHVWICGFKDQTIICRSEFHVEQDLG